MSTEAKKKGPAYIHWDDGQVFVTPADYDKFMIAASKAVKSLQIAVKAEEWAHRFFENIVPRICEWCNKRASQISRCYISFPFGPSLKIFVTARDDYDLDLGKEIAGLELELSNQEWPFDILQLPNSEEEELRAFFNPENTLLVYGQAETASRKSRRKSSIS